MTSVTIDIVREALEALHGEEITARMEGRSGVVENAITEAQKALDHLLCLHFVYGNK